MDDLLTVDEAAAYLRVSRATVWRWCKARKVPAFKIGREWRIAVQPLQQLAVSTWHSVEAQDTEPAS